MLNRRLETRDWWLIAAIALISCIIAFYYECNQIISGDQYQMLAKGYHALITGEFLPYGNEASTVGNVPGSLSSIVVGLPLIIYPHPLSPVVLLLLIRYLGFFIFVNALTLVFSRKTVIIGALLYALNPWFLYDSLLYNPSYLSFGATIFLNMLIRLRSYNEISLRSRFICSVLLVLAGGWCLQFHYSWPVLGALFFILYIKNNIKISYLGITLGVLLLALSLIPYALEVLTNEKIITNPENYAKERYFGYGLVHVYPLFKALLYWLRFGSILVTQKSIVAASVAGDLPLFLEWLRYAWLGLTQVVGGISVLLSVYANYILIFKKRELKEQDKDFSFIRNLCIATVISILVAAAAATLTLNYWQIILIFPFALLPLLCLIEKRPTFFKSRYIVIFAIFMILMNVVSASNSRKFHVSESYVDAVNLYCYERYQEKCRLADDALQRVLKMQDLKKQQ